MSIIAKTFRNYAGGVVTSGLARDQEFSSPKGWNSILVQTGMKEAYPKTRPGFSTLNSANGNIAAGGVIGQFEYRTVSAGTFTRRHAYVIDDGRIGVISSTGTLTAIASSIFTGGVPPDFAQAKNLLFVVNPANRRKLRGTTLENFGITRPATAPSVASGGAGIMTGTYQVRVTFYNGNTGHESSASDTSSAITLASNSLSVTSVPTSGDAQTTARRVYIRNNSNQSEFRLAGTIANNTGTSITLNVDTNTLTTLGPDTAENDPPPATIKYLAWVNGRMFAADDSNIYWSKKDKPEAFDPDAFEPVGAEDGQKITGLVGFAGTLVVFKNRSAYVLSGLTPESWQLRALFEDVGAVSHRSIVVAGRALWWWSENGPMKWDGTGPPLEVGKLLIEDSIVFNEDYGYLIQATVDPDEKLVLWTFPEPTRSRNTRIVALNYQLSSFVSDKWDPFDVASLATVADANGKRWVFAGNYNGQIFKCDPAVTNDGLVGGTKTGTFVAGATSTTSITGSGFYTTGQGLIERYVSVENASGVLMGRSRINSNTATTLTLNNAITGLTVGETYTYHIGGIAFEWHTPIEDEGEAFLRKRFKFALVQTDATGATVGVQTFTDENESTPKNAQTFIATQNSKGVITKRLSVGVSGLSWQLGVYNRRTDEQVSLYEAGMRSIPLNGKLA